MDNQTYWIPHDVYLCPTEDGTVFLDVQRDKYFAIDNEYAGVLEQTVSGFPSTVATDPNPSSQVIAAAAKLEEKGLLTRDHRAGKRYIPAALAPVDIASSFAVLELRPQIRPHHVAAFARAWITSTGAFRRHSLKQITDDLRRGARGEASSGARANTAGDLYSIFNSLRSLLITADNRCLPLALWLRFFMASYGYRPQLVIGVTSTPFNAHAWLQLGQLAFDPRPDRLDRLAPIFVL
jgi:Transglutaminase-like superfamily